MALESARVTPNFDHFYNGMVDSDDELWNGHLTPGLPLEEVRRLAEDMQSYIREGYVSDTIHVLDVEWPNWGDPKETRTVVVYVGWLAMDGGVCPKESVRVLECDESGLYYIGAGEWTWAYAPNDVTSDDA